MSEIDKVLEEYGIPSESELGKAGCYIQNTHREKKQKPREEKMMLYLFR